MNPKHLTTSYAPEKLSLKARVCMACLAAFVVGLFAIAAFYPGGMPGLYADYDITERTSLRAHFQTAGL